MEWKYNHGYHNSCEPNCVNKSKVENHRMPYCRFGSATWVEDPHNELENLWLFGGRTSIDDSDYRLFNDLWHYETVYSNRWIKEYFPKDAVIPPARYGAASWSDSSNNLWILGGRDETQILDDIWKYNIDEKKWTKINPVGILVRPYPRMYPSTFIKDDVVYIHGGLGQPPCKYCSPGLLDDLWAFNITTLTWIHIEGENFNQTATYGEMGVASKTSNPGSRAGSSFWRIDDKLWIFGGEVYIKGNNSESSAVMNDMWFYDLTVQSWTWYSGSNNVNDAKKVPSVSPGIPTTFEYPQGRAYSPGWSIELPNERKRFYFFSGMVNVTRGAEGLNDLWMFTPENDLFPLLNLILIGVCSVGTLIIVVDLVVEMEIWSTDVEHIQ
eukprot:TRINITY_DN1334_c0_g1_i2.p1 TRINITY_DN1334_c0_g1~~TRINITY_DN1334_c0_g1_i2.p1  ORF type:complete len:382 (+),score=82.78 TRINITY_DN1334_c0_g1_i2:689-1834(+)